jgi:rhodanese-related sulfurtransferase
MKRFLKLMVLVLVLSLSTKVSAAPYKEVTADELVKMKKDNKDLVIIDSRGGDWFDGTLIEGAQQLAAGDTNAESLAKLAPKKDQSIVFYCTNEECPASSKAAHKAAELGYSNLFKYKAGIDGWKKLGLPTTQLAKK